MNPAVWLARAARRAPGRTALLRGTCAVADYATFAQRAAALGGALRERHHLASGDRVALFMTNDTTYLEAMYGAWFAGCAAVPINAKLHPREAAWIIEDADARVAFVSPALATALAPVAPACLEALIETPGPGFESLAAHDRLAAPQSMGPDDMSWLFYTSGTTGRPKGVMMTTANIRAMACAYMVDVDHVGAGDCTVYAAPMSHGAGIYNVVFVLTGARHAVPESGGFDAAELLALAPRLGEVSLFAAPTMIRRLVDRAKADGVTGQGLKTIVYGGGPMYLADIIEAVEVMGPRFVQIYGQGECPMSITALSRQDVADRGHPRWRERLASVGLAQSCVEVAVVDEVGVPLPPGRTGEVAVRGAPVMAGYWRNPEATARAIRDGWLWTGDMGALDEDGYLTLLDRSKDVIISGGTNIYPREVEEALLEHPSVHEVAVVGRPDPEWGEAVVAFVVTVPGAALDTAALDAHCLDRIARFKRPKRYRFLDALPKNNYGKVLKTALRGMLDDGAAAQ